MLRRVLMIAGLAALAGCASAALAQSNGEPGVSSKGTVEHHYVRRWEVSSPKGLDIKLRLPRGWCIAEGATSYSADFYRPKEKYPTFFMITCARLPMPFETLIEKDIARLTKPAEGEPMTVKEMPPLMEGRMRSCQFDTAGEGSHCLVGYYNVQDEYMVKVMLANTAGISPSLRRAFKKIVAKMAISLNHPAMTQEEALKEAPRRAKAAGAAGMEGVKYGGGDGSSYASAVLVSKARNIFGCVAAQYAWLDAHYPGYEFLMHAGGEKDGRSYSVISFSFEGKAREVYFDISECPHD